MYRKSKTFPWPKFGASIELTLFAPGSHMLTKDLIKTYSFSWLYLCVKGDSNWLWPRPISPLLAHKNGPPVTMAHLEPAASCSRHCRYNDNGGQNFSKGFSFCPIKGQKMPHLMS